MKILKAIKSTFEALGIMFIIMFGYFLIDDPEEFVLADYLISGAISVFLVWLTNKSFRWMADHGEFEECPWCGAVAEWEEAELKSFGGE